MRPPLIIVGSGLAGLLTAILAGAERPVLILTKKGLKDSNTEQSQGGIAAVWNQQDSTQAHVSDTFKAGAGLGDKQAIEAMSTQSKEAIDLLVHCGVQFDRNEQGEYLLALEGAHSRPRVLHAGGDATGTEIMRALTREALSHPNITIIEQASLAEILTHKQAVSGIRYYHNESDLIEIECEEMVLATGGAGQLFCYTSNPPTATGEGIVLAYRAGAQLSDLEFFQFHPTALNLKEMPNFLITEAMRGAGATIRNSQGKAFLKDYDPRGDLASRDVVSRAIFAEMKKGPVFLDATSLGHLVLKTRFPNVSHACLNYGVRIESEPIPITPVAHYLMGGVKVDLFGRSTLKGLYVAGEAARTGVHGANRLASNSLLEGATFAMQVAKAISQDLRQIPTLWQDQSLTQNKQTRPQTEPNAPPLSRSEFRQAMWDYAGIIRNEKGLKQLLNLLGAPPFHPPEQQTQAEYELQNMRHLGRLLALSALARAESKGSHYRSDYPPLEEN